jgi:hypothetical protein
MIKKLKPALLFLILVVILQRTNGQMPINLTADLSKKFLNYTESVPREEIYVHSDRNKYVSGEDLWFNIYLIDRQTLKPSVLSKIAYFELLNSENRPVVQKKILLDGGFGPGQIVLPDTLSTGTYTIRAYTNWMKNFLPVNCFSKDIQIYNAFSSRKSKSTKISDKFLSTGKPEYNSGLTLKVNNLIPEVLEISVSTDEKYRSENSPQFYLFIQTHGIMNRVSSELLLGGAAKIIIPKNQLTAGINQITVFNSNGLPVAERYIYTPENRNDFVSIRSDDSISCRDKLTINIVPGNTSTVLAKGSNISISVAPVSDDNIVSNITDYNIFASEYGPIKWNTRKFKKIADIPPAEMDSMLLGVRSNWIDWQTILSVEEPLFKYPIETENHFITGKLSSGTGSDSGRIVVMSPPGKTPVFQYAKTDRNGNFSFKVGISNRINDLIIQPDEILKNQTVTIETPFSDKYYKTSPDSSNQAISENLLNMGVNQQVRKIYRITAVSDTIFPTFAHINIRRFYGKPDQELIMKDYITLPVMQEVFFELLVGVFLKTKKSGYEITMNDIVNNIPFETAPALFVDGVMVKDPAAIAAIDPEMVEKIDVIRQKYFVGDYLFTGIVNIITKAGDFSNVPLPAYSIRVPYRVFDPEIAFHSPEYSSVIDKASRVPDFRNTIYWNPAVKADKEGKASVEFWTSDFKSDFEVNIQGISPDGNAFSLRKIIKVKK